MHPLIEAAAAGRLPDWADVSHKRAEHIARVSALMGEWSDAANMRDEDRKRWRAAGTLHDALHSAKHEGLRAIVPDVFKDLPGKMLHGPACVVKLREEGVDDEALLHAIEYHTIGHPKFDVIGEALYAADYLEPGRQEDPLTRTVLRSRMPVELHNVVAIILRERMMYHITQGQKIRPETIAFWNAIADERQA
jgi:2-amino-4-hydroxy-6-hydroxymethyldihydropteridine diphosphokinase